MSASDASNGFGASSYAGRSGVSVVNPSGTATYRGGVIGLYGVTGSAPVYTVGDMTAAANFDSNTISLFFHFQVLLLQSFRFVITTLL